MLQRVRTPTQWHYNTTDVFEYRRRTCGVKITHSPIPLANLSLGVPVPRTDQCMRVRTITEVRKKKTGLFKEEKKVLDWGRSSEERGERGTKRDKKKKITGREV